jgi:hypothetical protein
MLYLCDICKNRGIDRASADNGYPLAPMGVAAMIISKSKLPAFKVGMKAGALNQAERVVTPVNNPAHIHRG